MFTAVIEAGENKTEAVFYVAVNGKQCLLGDATAKELKVLKIGFEIEPKCGSVIPKDLSEDEGHSC